jgi:spore cortex biosynthesis protein YabQ
MGPALFETSNQLWVFLFTVYGGVVLGLLYDLLSVIRMFLKGKHVLIVFFDILFWLVAAALSFALLYYACDGEFRYYDVLGFGLGAALWFLGPGKGLKWICNKINRGLHLVWNRFKGTVLYRFLFK